MSKAIHAKPQKNPRKIPCSSKNSYKKIAKKPFEIQRKSLKTVTKQSKKHPQVAQEVAQEIVGGTESRTLKALLLANRAQAACREAEAGTANGKAQTFGFA